MTDFVHLHVHTDFSLLDGAGTINKLVARAKELGQKALAITDHGNLFGVINFEEACNKAGIKPIIGCEFYVACKSRTEKEKDENARRYYHLILLAKNEVGYRNLVVLSSLSYTEGMYYKPRIDDELLRKHSEGLICLTACLAGKLPVLLMNNKETEAENFLRSYIEIFGFENLYLELQDHGLKEQKQVAPKIIEMARRLGLPLVVTNDIHYCNKDDAIAQDVLMCIGMKKRFKDEDRMRFETDQFYLKSGDEMAVLFPEYPEAVLNTVRIAERCNLTIPKPGPRLPIYRIPEQFSTKEEYIDYLVYEGLKKRYPELLPAHKERAEYELGIIKKMDFVGYFLIVWDFINWAKEHEIPVGPGRGSGAGSLVAYAMRITDVDPFKYNLLFERFLNPERVSLPDFDVDFCFERRQEVIKYVHDKYGAESVALITTFGTLQPAVCIKDVGRTLDIPLSEVEAIVSALGKNPDDPDIKMDSLSKMIEHIPEVKEFANMSQYQQLFEIAQRLEGCRRNTSLHAAGVVIAQGNVSDYVPIQKDSKSEYAATQFTMDKIEQCGLVKMDFLGLKTLTLIKHCEDLVRLRGGEYANFSIESISEEDKKTFELLSQGNATAVFQFESPGMINILKRCKPTCIPDLIALNALYRPGPMQYIDQFIESKNNPSLIKYPDPSLEDILKETYGVIVYQEQVMQVAQKFAGYTLGAADMLRRAMSKKKVDVMAANKEIFVKGAVQCGNSEAKAGEIYDILIPFSQYGFNKSHATAYAVMAYRTAYLKAHFLPEFWAANFTNEINNSTKLKEYMSIAKKDGVEILPPHVNHSHNVFTVLDGSIIFGLTGIKGVGDKVALAIAEEREKKGKFTSFMNFLTRVDLKSVPKKAIEIMINTGCFDGLDQNRPTLLFNLDSAYECAVNQVNEKLSGQGSLFGDEPQEIEYFNFKVLDDWPTKEKLKIEKQILGLYISGHPLSEYSEIMEKTSNLSLSNIHNAQKDKLYTIIGLLSELSTLQTRQNKEMAFAEIEDMTTSIKAVFFPKTWEQMRHITLPETVCGVVGKIESDGSSASIIVDKVIPLKELREMAITEVHVALDAAFYTKANKEALQGLNSLFTTSHGTNELFIHAQTTEKSFLLKASQNIKVPSTKDFLDKVKNLAGVESVWLE